MVTRGWLIGPGLTMDRVRGRVLLVRVSPRPFVVLYPLRAEKAFSVFNITHCTIPIPFLPEREPLALVAGVSPWAILVTPLTVIGLMGITGIVPVTSAPLSTAAVAAASISRRAVCLPITVVSPIRLFPPHPL